MIKFMELMDFALDFTSRFTGFMLPKIRIVKVKALGDGAVFSVNLTLKFDWLIWRCISPFSCQILHLLPITIRITFH